MAEVTLTIGDRRHIVACRDGEEGALRRIGEMLDSRWAAAQRASGGLNNERTMLFVALMLADSLADLQNGRTNISEDTAPVRAAASVDPALLGQLADRLEAIASALEA